MTQQILVSDLRGATDFAARVTAHCAELNAHAAHMGNVKAGKADPYPPPFAPALVARAVREDTAADGTVRYVEDYAIVDDGPTPDHVFADKKNALLAQVTALERAAQHAIVPLGKRRLLARQVAAAASKPAENLTADDKNALAAEIARRQAFDAIDQHAATEMAAIEDLTPGTIDAWTPTSFPTR